MKKILAGMFFRLFRGFEIWALIGLLLIASTYIFSATISNQYYMSYEAGMHKTFEDLGVSDLDVYKFSNEPISRESFDKLLYEDNVAGEELNCLEILIGFAHLIPAILIAIFIPVFFGRMFSDGTIKNYIICGYKKGDVYLSSLCLTFVIDIVIMVLNVLILVLVCCAYSWHPPVYLPVCILQFVIVSLVLFTVSSIIISVMFISSKRTIAFIAGFLVIFLITTPLSSTIAESMMSSYYEPASDAQIEELRKERETMDKHDFGMKIDLSEHMIRMYNKDKELKEMGTSSLPPVLKTVCLAVIYLDPIAMTATGTGEAFPWYLAYRDGLMAICVASNVFWIILANGIGLVVTKKREIKA